MSKIEFKVWEKNITSRKDLPSFPSETLVRIIKGSFLKKKINLNKNSKVLEVGCGFGNNLLVFKDTGCKLYGTEVTSKTCNVPYNNLLNNGLSSKIKVGENTNLPFPKNYFDLLISLNTIQYEKNEKDINKALNEYSRVLKKNGSLILFTVGPKHFSYNHAKIVKPNVYSFKNWNGIKKQIFFHFDSLMHLKYFVGKKFSFLETGTTYENLMGTDLDYLIIKAVKK